MSGELLAQPELRIEGRAKVTGVAEYAADVRRPGMLHAGFLGSPFPHARIVSVGTATARAMPGVHAVITGADVRPARFGRRFQDWPALCWDRARFVGDRVAAVAAETPAQAAAAARAIEVRYEELPAAFTPEEALAPGATPIHPEIATYTMLGAERQAEALPNLRGRRVHEHGDVDAAFAGAARVFEHTFEVARVHQGYLEPRASVVWIEGDRVHVLTTNKSPFQLRDQMAASLGLPPERIEVETAYIGGDFGGKGLSIEEHALYFLAKASGRPVRGVMRYADELMISNTRHGGRIRMRTGVDAGGRIVAHEARVTFDGGAYAAGNPGLTLMPGEAMYSLAGYRVPAARVEALSAYTNTLPAGNARAPGQPQLSFAAESHIDAIARGLGLDPLDFRARNLAHDGDLNVAGEHAHHSEAAPVIATLREAAGWAAPLAPGRGRGAALGIRHVGRGHAVLQLTLTPDGAIEIFTGVTDQGGGGYTLLQRVAAAELGIPAERISVRRGTTTTALPDPGVGGSKLSQVQGHAALDGARQLKALLAERAPGLPFAAAAARVAPVRVTGTGDQPELVYGAYAFALEVAVDPDTGAFRIEDATLVADVGTVLNPVALRGQLEGGFAYGLGQACTEEVVVADGRVVTSSLGEYKLPSIADVPQLRIVLHEGPPGPGPFGAKSVGELANSAVSAALANAIADATGVRVLSLPLTAEKVRAGLTPA